MSHHVHHMYFGNKPTKRRRKSLEANYPQFFSLDWLDKLAGQAFISENAGATYEHYLQTVMTTVEPTKAKRLDAYEYTVQSHAYDAEDHASVKFTYKMSPIQIVVSEKIKPFYHFITSVCAVVGGVFTVAGLMDGMAYNTAKAFKKKVDLGKQG
jgi:hypothetical protein